MGEAPLARLGVILGVVLASHPALAETPPASPPVSVETWETHVTIDGAGRVTTDTHDVYRLLVGDPPPWYTSIYRVWSWRDEPPVLQATVTSPDGTVVKLDPATVSDQPIGHDDLTFSDRKRRVAPLPGLAIGALVDRRMSSVRRPDLVDGGNDVIPLAWDVPVKKRVVVVDVPAGVPLHWKVVGAPAVKPRRQERNGQVTWTFEVALPAVKIPVPLSPRGDQQLPELHIGTVRSWQSVAAAWAARADAQIDVDEARSLASEITKGLSDRDAKARAILAWMAANLRYTGVELGAAAWTPVRTREVLSRRYGDCKDLALLLVALLRAAGVDADMALVAAGSGSGPAPEVPGLNLFDHAIVRAGSGPPVWLDPTVPFEAYGEAAGLVGRPALIARPDSTTLGTIVASATSRLDGRIEITMADEGRARVRVVTSSEGSAFSAVRRLAAHDQAGYRSAMERFVRDVWRAELPIQIDVADALAPGPLHETLEVPDALVGMTTGTDANAAILVGKLLDPFEVLEELDKQGALSRRTEPIELPWAVSARVVNVIHPPDGFRAAALPKDVDFSAGPVKLTAHVRSHDDVIEGTLALELARGTISADDARRLVRDTLPELRKIAITLRDGIYEELEQQKPYTAAKDAAAAVAAHPTPANRSRLADALGRCGLVEAAAAEARRALAEAPDVPLVRNRVAFALSFDVRGEAFARGFLGTEVLALTQGTLAKHPDDDWARRLHVVAEQTVPGVDLAALGKEIRDYRARTHQTGLEQALISVRLQQHAWKELAAECPGVASSPERDAACLAADLVVQGAATLDRAGGVDATTARTAVLDLTLAREYDVVRKLVAENAALGLERSEVEIFQKLRRCAIPAGDRKEPIAHFMRAAAEDRLGEMRPWLDPPEPMTRAEQKTVRAVLSSLIAIKGKPGMIGDLACDLLDAAPVEVRPLEGFGELVTFHFDLGGKSKTTLLVRRTPKGYRLDMADIGAIAAEGLRALATRPERAASLFQALQDLGGERSVGARGPKLGSPDTAPFAAAVLAVRDPKTRGFAVSWLDGQLERSDLTAAMLELVEVAYRAAFVEEPARLLTVARRMQALADENVARTGVYLELTALMAQGSFADARTRLAEEIKRHGHDRRLDGYGQALQIAMGDFIPYREEAARRAATLKDREAANLLNNAAWYSIFTKPDPAARAQAERAVELSPVAGYVNTQAAVYAELGLWDEAVLAFQRQQAIEDDDDGVHDKGYLWVRGQIAEALGQPAIAAAIYRKIERAKNGTADDVFLLAAPRLKALAPAGP